MKLRSARVTNFRSAENSSVEETEPFLLNQITCLVGKNEAGKTAILQAIAGLNPHPATPFIFEKERDYPRRYLNFYDERHPDEDAVVVTTFWEITDAEKNAISAVFGGEALTGAEVKILRRYGAAAPEWSIPINVTSAITHLVSEANFNAAEQSQLQGAVTSTETLRNKLSEIGAPTAKHTALLSKLDNFPGRSITGQAKAILNSGFPRFMYFSHYDRMSGEVMLERLREDREEPTFLTDESHSGDRLFLEFLDYAGSPLDEILSAETYELFTAKLQAASNGITDQILEYWSQNLDIEVRVTVDAAKSGDPPPFNTGTIGRARVYNGLHRVDGPFSERSAGFIWFFSFLIKFAQVKNDSTPVVLLLDEPGLSLHGKAQADLLRYFEERLALHHQIIYSTHSPFMVPADKLTSARIVDDLVNLDSRGRRTPLGTKVRKDVLHTDQDSIFPLQGALGYDITQTLFIGKHTLLVEGPSDILYLKALSAALQRRRRNSLDPRWTLCPSGGIGNVVPFVSLFKGNELNIAVLTDYKMGEKNAVERLRRSEILNAGAVLTIDKFTGKQEADTEDLFEPEVFVDLLNSAYGLTAPNTLTPDRLETADASTPRLIQEGGGFFSGFARVDTCARPLSTIRVVD